jgi:threonine dehydratase
MNKLGAEVIATGADFDESMDAAQVHAEETGAIFIHSMNEPHLVAGVGTYTLELMEFEPNIDVIFAPVGGGSGLCGALVTAKGINPDIKVFGVQSIGAPAVHDSWVARKLLKTERADTFAEGIATREAFALPADIIWKFVDGIALVSDPEIKRAMLTYLERTRLLVEGAGASPLAAAYARREELAGKTVALIISGGNVTLDVLASAINEEKPL